MVRAQEIVRSDGEVVRRKPREGDMRWDGKVWRRWSGRRWATAAYSLRPDRLRSPQRIDADDPIDPDVARRFLLKAVEDQVATNGATVVLDGEQGVILGYRRRVPHLLHALLTVFSAGLWAVAWILSSVGSGEERIRLSMDDWGNVWAKPLGKS